MVNRTKYLRSMLPIATLATIALLSSCATTNGVIEMLDPETGVTISHSRTPVTLYRDTPSYGANARNFVQIGAIDVNRMGTHQYFLWLGIWNTVQLASIADHRDGFDSVVLFTDGEPLFLDVAGWTESAIGASMSIYLRPVATSVDAYYRITIGQLELLAGATDIRIETTGTSPRRFELWDAQTSSRKDLQELLDRHSR